jgi:hypothetical protein
MEILGNERSACNCGCITVHNRVRSQILEGRKSFDCNTASRTWNSSSCQRLLTAHMNLVSMLPTPAMASSYVGKIFHSYGTNFREFATTGKKVQDSVACCRQNSEFSGFHVIQAAFSATFRGLKSSCRPLRTQRTLDKLRLYHWSLLGQRVGLQPDNRTVTSQVWLGDTATLGKFNISDWLHSSMR